MKILRQNRRSLVITINEDGEVVVKAPIFVSSKKIEEFLTEKEDWINKQLKRNEERRGVVKSFDFEKYVYINGEPFSWEEIQKKNRRRSKASYYSQKFSENVVFRAKQWAELLKISEVQFKLCNSRCIWGSCNSSKLIKLNWKMIILPVNLQDYIIVHELCHTIQLNHSPKFWKFVEKYLPNFKFLRSELKKYSVLLREEVLI